MSEQTIQSNSKQKSDKSTMLDQVLELVLEGDSNMDIALKLGKSEGTIKMYISMLFLLHGVKTRPKLLVKLLKKPKMIDQGIDTTQSKLTFEGIPNKEEQP